MDGHGDTDIRLVARLVYCPCRERIASCREHGSIQGKRVGRLRYVAAWTMPSTSIDTLFIPDWASLADVDTITAR